MSKRSIPALRAVAFILAATLAFAVVSCSSSSDAPANTGKVTISVVGS